MTTISTKQMKQQSWTQPWMRWKMKVKEIGIQEGKQMKREHGKRRRELTDAIPMLGDVLEVEPDNQEAKTLMSEAREELKTNG